MHKVRCFNVSNIEPINAIVKPRDYSDLACQDEDEVTSELPDMPFSDDENAEGIF